MSTSHASPSESPAAATPVLAAVRADERCFVLHGEHVVRVRGAALAERLRHRWRLPDAPTEATRVLCTLEAVPGATTEPIEHRVGRGGFRDDGSLGGAVRVDLATLEPGCHLSVSPQADPDDLLPWLNVLLPAAGVLPLHASGFCVDGAGVAVAGLAHSGKTGVLLAAADAGMPVVGDECLWLAPDGGVRGLDVTAEVRLRYLDELPAYRSRVPLGARGRARLLSGLGRCARGLAPALARRLEAAARVRVATARLFPVRTGPVGLAHLFLSVPHASAVCAAAPISADEARWRLHEILRMELRPIAELYGHYRYLFPGRRGDWLEGLDALLAERLAAGLAGVHCSVLRHPYPSSPREAFAVVRRSLG